MAFDTDAWPFIGSAHYGNTNGRTVRLVVIHDMEAPEKSTTAESVARYFARGSVKASAHLCIDSDSIIQCVKDSDVAYAAPGANNDGIQLELAGYARQTREQWLDAYSKAVLENAARATAQYCVKYNLPVVKLTNTELVNGKRGIIGHIQASQAYKKSSHTDPGNNFPWEYFLQRVRFWHPYYKNGRKWPAAPAPIAGNSIPYGKAGSIIPGTRDRWLGLTAPEMTGADVNGVRNALRKAGNYDLPERGGYNLEVARLIELFQRNRGITERGVGPQTWEALREVVHG